MTVVARVSCLDARFIVGDLSGRLLEQTSSRAHDRVRQLLDSAVQTGDAAVDVLASQDLVRRMDDR